jgi:hypothetical protein
MNKSQGLSPQGRPIGQSGGADLLLKVTHGLMAQNGNFLATFWGLK